jgi:hypothetical protein
MTPGPFLEDLLALEIETRLIGGPIEFEQLANASRAGDNRGPRRRCDQNHASNDQDSTRRSNRSEPTGTKKIAQPHAALHSPKGFIHKMRRLERPQEHASIQIRWKLYLQQRKESRIS